MRLCVRCVRLHVFWQNMPKRRKFDLFVLFLFTILLVIGLIRYKHKNDTQHEETERVHEEVRELLLMGVYKTYGIECSPMTQNCFQVVDRAREDGPRVMVERSMTLEDLRGYVNSAARLKSPEKLNHENKNVSKWTVDKLDVPDGYFQTMIVAPFATEAMSHNKTSKQKVMMLGLGGGTIPNFFSVIDHYGITIETTVVELDPFIADMATKYFDFRPVKGLTNLIIADGVAVLKKAVEKKVKYNAIFLDACYSSDEKNTGLLCPVEEFFTTETIRNMYESLEEEGTLAINTVYDKNETYWETNTLHDFGQIFPSCDYISYGALNRMMICTKKKAWSFQKQGPRFIMNIRRINKMFGFNLHRFF